ncbi:MAG: hypothetical protein WC453_01225 [Patescibacteria group bacterium]
MFPLPLPIHLSIHFILAVLVGYLAGKRFNQVKWGIIGGVLGGFFIDLDHVLEYLLVFGPHFNPIYFLEGRQFLTSDQIHIWFHAWEYVPLILLAAWLLRLKKVVAAFLVALTLGGLIHMFSDALINEYPLRNYSLIYRYEQGFSAKKLLNPSQYGKYQTDRFYYGM